MTVAEAKLYWHTGKSDRREIRAAVLFIEQVAIQRGWIKKPAPSRRVTVIKEKRK